MTWTAITGESPIQSPGDVVTTVFVTDVASGKQFKRDYRNDGTTPSLVSAVRATLGKVDPATSQATTVPPGTILDLTDPVTQPPTPAEKARNDYFAAKRTVSTLGDLVRLKRAGVTQQMLDDATTQWNALPFLASYEGLA